VVTAAGKSAQLTITDAKPKTKYSFVAA